MPWNAHLQNTAWIVAIVIVAVGPAAAQELEKLPEVISEGTGTVYLAPSHVVFWLHYDLTADNLKQNLATPAARLTALREYLSGRELRPASLEAYPPRIESLEESRGTWSVELRFPMAGLVGGETGAMKLGALCESMKTLSEDLTCQVSDPSFKVADETLAIQDAVKVATEQAFTAGSGAAAALNTEIRAVTQVRVLDITWNDPPNTQARYPNIEVIACTARVRVAYTVH